MTENPNPALDPAPAVDDRFYPAVARALPQYHEAEAHHSSGNGGHGMVEDQQVAGETGKMYAEEPSEAANIGIDPKRTPVSPEGGSSGLALSFKGKVYVFDSVSPEKVQVVLSFLGGQEMNTGSDPFSSSSKQNSRVDMPHEIPSLMRPPKKRKERKFYKKDRCNVRKEIAQRPGYLISAECGIKILNIEINCPSCNLMQRHHGQFVSSKSKSDDSLSGITTMDATEKCDSRDNPESAASECEHCGISARSTSMMRRGPGGPWTLCNACGLVWLNKQKKERDAVASAMMLESTGPRRSPRLRMRKQATEQQNNIEQGETNAGYNNQDEAKMERTPTQEDHNKKKGGLIKVIVEEYQGGTVMANRLQELGIFLPSL